MFERTCEFSGIQFTKHFIELVFAEANAVVRSNSNMILTRQTCGHRSSRVAGSKRRALAFSVSIQIWYVFLLSKCRGKSDLGVCMTSALAKRMQLHTANFGLKNVFGRRIRRKSAMRSCIHFASTEVMHRTISDFSLRFDIKNTYQIRTENKILALGVCFPQSCSSDGRRFAASRSLLNHYRTIVSFPQERIR